jgi:hypothetical protein
MQKIGALTATNTLSTDGMTVFPMSMATAVVVFGSIVTLFFLPETNGQFFLL